MSAIVFLAVTLAVSPAYSGGVAAYSGVAAAAYNGYTLYFIHQRARKRAQEREDEERKRKRAQERAQERERGRK